ncbi:MAG: glycerol-3-phosphate 1-O-acyltransferase PlsY [Proteobacteria bacterium]|nr:glycerol-3-phosphate 1-O-acyltransferase PlsY [Pseudomonadota bacterium]
MLHPINWSLVLPYYAAALAFGYLLGSIPFGLILTRLSGMPDIRGVGSGNIGATNVLRAGNKGLAVATLVGDALKGTAAVLLAYRAYGQDLAVLAALGAFLGHLFPVWLRFRGGKGVSTYIGLLIGLAWPMALAFAAIWLAVAAATRYSSLASVIACAATPVILWFNRDLQEAQLFLLLSLLVWVMHRSNIARLITGREGKIGAEAPPMAG